MTLDEGYGFIWTERVVPSGTKLEWAPVLGGVPQGSIIGPLLFILYVNEIPDLVHCNVKMFADDRKLYTAIKSQVDLEQLQSDVYTL